MKQGAAETIEGTHLLVAAGRTADHSGLDLEAAGIAYDGSGIAVNKKLKTSNKRVYAIGDVAAGQLQFTHAANYHAGLVIRNALFRLPVRVSNDVIPWVTYTEPELAQTGLSEAEARKRGIKIRILRWPYHDNDRAQAERETHGHIKVITKMNGKDYRRHDCRRSGRRIDHDVDAGDRAGAQYSRLYRHCRALSDAVGNRQTRGHRLLYARFDEPVGAAHHSLAANFRLRRNWNRENRNTERARRANRAAAPRVPCASACPANCLFLTVLFVMVAEILIYVPSIANFRLNWLNDRLAAAHTAALVLDAAPSGMVPESLAKEILKSIGARAVAMKMGDQRRLLAVSNPPSRIEQDIDMRNMSWWRATMDAFEVLLFDQAG